MSTVRDIMKKAICIAITAALVVAFSFALVACNDNGGPTTADITDNDIIQLRAVLSVSSGYSSYGRDITKTSGTGDNQVTEHTVVSVYTNGSRQNTVDIETEVSANGTVTTTYIHAGMNSAEELVYASAVYEDGVLVSTPVYNHGSEGTKNIGIVIGESGALEALNNLLNIIGETSYFTISGTVTSYDNGSTVYTINYNDETNSGTATVTVSGGVITQIVFAANGETFTTGYTYDLGRKGTLSESEWNELHPAE